VPSFGHGFAERIASPVENLSVFVYATLGICRYVTQRQLCIIRSALHHGLLKRLGVVVLHRTPVNARVTGVKPGVDHAVVAQGGAGPLAKLAVVELDD